MCNFGPVDLGMEEEKDLHRDFTRREIGNVIYNWKKDKSPGIFGIEDNTLKLIWNKFPITETMNNTLNTRIMEESWAKGILVLLHKKGIHNYRPITLLTTLWKIITAAINNRIMRYMEKNNLFNGNQAGFRRRMGCQPNVAVLHTTIGKRIKKCTEGFTVFLDFSKDYDRVWHNGLWIKMARLGISHKIVNSIQKTHTCFF